MYGVISLKSNSITGIQKHFNSCFMSSLFKISKHCCTKPSFILINYKNIISNLRVLLVFYFS